MGNFMSAVSSQVQRAINEEISDQILPQIQATLRSGQGPMPERRWEVPVRGQGYRSEEVLNRRFRSNWFKQFLHSSYNKSHHYYFRHQVC